MSSPLSDRRGDDRADIRRDCSIDVKSPSWAKLSKPATGITANLTLNGMKMFLPDFSTVQFETWKNRLDADESIRVAIQLDEIADLAFDGELVWCDFEPGEGARGMCTAGVLLSIADESHTQAIQRVLARRERESMDSDLVEESD